MAVLGAVIPSVSAQEDPRLALVDFQKLQRECYLAEQQKQAFGETNTRERAELDKLELEHAKTLAQLEPLQKELQEKLMRQGSPTDEERNRLNLLRSGLRSITGKLRTEQQRYTSVMTEEANRLHGELAVAIRDEIAVWAEGSDVDLILDRSFGAEGAPALAWGAESIPDITSGVLNSLNEGAPEDWTSDNGDDGSVSDAFSTVAPPLSKLRVGLVDYPVVQRGYQRFVEADRELVQQHQEGMTSLTSAQVELDELTSRRNEIRNQLENEPGLEEAKREELIREGRDIERKMLSLIQQTREQEAEMQKELSDQKLKVQSELGEEIRQGIEAIAADHLDLVINQGFEIRNLPLIAYLDPAIAEGMNEQVIHQLNEDAPGAADSGEMPYETFAPGSVALVDQDEVLRAYDVAQKEADRFQQQYEEARAELTAQQQQIQSMYQEQQAAIAELEKADLSEPEKQKEMEAARLQMEKLEQMGSRLVQMGNEMRSSLEAEVLESRKGLKEQVRSAVGDEAEAKGYRLVMDSAFEVRGVRPVVWYRPGRLPVLSQDVIDRINQEAKAQGE